MTTQLLSECHRRLSYDPISGLLTWKINASTRAKVGDVAGTKDKNGYIAIGINIDGKRKNYCAHRLAWLMTTGALPINHIDHINGIGTDNRWNNLREATRSENMHNSKKRVTNTSGFKGVSFHKAANKFTANIWLNSKRHHLGCFITAEEAYKAYCIAAKEMHGSFVNFG